MCFIATLFVLGIVSERENGYSEAREEIASNWADTQVIAGPMLVISDPTGKDGEMVETVVLPSALTYETILTPETRSLGIFETVVYRSSITVRGEFLGKDLRQAFTRKRNATLVVLMSDTKGIERESILTWAGSENAFSPGIGVVARDVSLGTVSGIHTSVPVDPLQTSIPFAFELNLRGTESLSVAPTGDTTSISMASTWKTPKFVGWALPSERGIGADGFNAQWKFSLLGRTYPQVWEGNETTLTQVIDSAVGVKLYRPIDVYNLVVRSLCPRRRLPSSSDCQPSRSTLWISVCCSSSR
jgi:inner membrane protein